MGYLVYSFKNDNAQQRAQMVSANDKVFCFIEPLTHVTLCLRMQPGVKNGGFEQSKPPFFAPGTAKFFGCVSFKKQVL